MSLVCVFYKVEIAYVRIAFYFISHQDEDAFKPTIVGQVLNPTVTWGGFTGMK